jgi:shikimate kinase
MGAGKTSVGQALGNLLGWAFEDLDDRVEQREGRAIEEIFAASGEQGFRRAEHAALRGLVEELGDVPRVVALGGGAFIQPANAELLREQLTIFLDAPAEELYRRCAQQDIQRPLRQNREQFFQLYESRRPGYLTAAARIDGSGKDVESIAKEIARILQSR